MAESMRTPGPWVITQGEDEDFYQHITQQGVCEEFRPGICAFPPRQNRDADMRAVVLVPAMITLIEDLDRYYSDFPDGIDEMTRGELEFADRCRQILSGLRETQE